MNGREKYLMCNGQHFYLLLCLIQSAHKMKPKNSPLRYILLAWLTAGTLDITAASIQFYLKTDKGPELILRYISRALIGKEASATGQGPVALGLILHYLNALLFTLFFYWIFPKWKLM